MTKIWIVIRMYMIIRYHSITPITTKTSLLHAVSLIPWAHKQIPIMLDSQCFTYNLILATTETYTRANIFSQSIYIICYFFKSNLLVPSRINENRGKSFLAAISKKYFILIYK